MRWDTLLKYITRGQQFSSNLDKVWDLIAKNNKEEDYYLETRFEGEPTWKSITIMPDFSLEGSRALRRVHIPQENHIYTINNSFVGEKKSFPYCMRTHVGYVKI